MIKLLRITLVASLMAFMAPAMAMTVNASGDGDEHGGGLQTQDFTLIGTRWDPGVNTANVNGAPAPGGATFSIAGAGLVDASGFDGGHVGSSLNESALGLGGLTLASVANWAMDAWAAVSGFTNLGEVADGGVNYGASEASGGALGDIRIGAWQIGNANVLAHAFQPGNESVFGAGGSIAGDTHFNTIFNWVDDAGDVTGNGNFDIFTVMLHELGHALGIGHSGVGGSVMEPVYAGARRTLTADDIAAIQAIYGAPEVQVPEPGTLWLFGLGLIGLGWARRRT